MTTEKKIQSMREKVEAFQGDFKTIEQIKVACCAAFGVTMAEMDSKARTRGICDARMAAIAISRANLRRFSVADIGRAFKKDHGTVINAIKAVENFRKTDRRFAWYYDQAIKLVTQFPDQ